MNFSITNNNLKINQLNTKVLFYFKIDICTKASGKRARGMVGECKYGKMAQFIKAIGKTT